MSEVSAVGVVGDGEPTTKCLLKLQGVGQPMGERRLDSEEELISEQRVARNGEPNLNRLQHNSQDVSLSELIGISSEGQDIEDLDSDSGSNKAQNSEGLNRFLKRIQICQDIISCWGHFLLEDIGSQTA
ncbi:hypothetical protein B0H13DRAFT_1865963 [Mycena leptocephala]|nr:hypothetical protein B0H13DRAFT_1865963 [Mycena leptocephala]